MFILLLFTCQNNFDTYEDSRSNIFFDIMKQQSKGITLKHEIKKEKVITYPYHLVSAIYYTQQDHILLVTVDYFSDSTVLIVNPFLKNMTKLSPSSINLNGILPRRIVTTIHVKKLQFKPTSNGVSIISGEFVLGYSSGQIAVVEYKDKNASFKARLNKSLKGQNFLSKTSSFFFGGEDTYPSYIKEPVKSFRVSNEYPDLFYSYQIGNHLFFTHELNESNQYSFFNTYESNSRQNFIDNYDVNTGIEKGNLQLFCCPEYYSLRDTSRKIGLMKFQQQVSCYQFLNPNRKEIAVSLSTKQTILLVSTVKFSINTKISMQMTIRSIYPFQHHKEQFLAILVYSNYTIFYNLNKSNYLKVIGFRSFTAGVLYDQKEQTIISSGMDHRVALLKLAQTKQHLWTTALIDNEKRIVIKDMDGQQLKFPEIFSIGQYNNVRTNLHSYGFADIFKIGDLFCMPTFDARHLMYKYG